MGDSASNCPACTTAVFLSGSGPVPFCPTCGVSLQDADPDRTGLNLGPMQPTGEPGAKTPVGRRSDAIPMPFSPEFLAQYQFEKVLGQGGMGAVFLMTHLKLDRLVAAKVVKGDEITADETRRLLKEAQVLAALNHPNILSVHDAGNDGPIPYIVCEYVERQSLAERLRKSPPLSLRQGLGLIVHILEALRVAHEKGIVHRDLKPANIFLTRDGKPKIGDFGLAKAQSLPSGTIVGKLMGTPAYMSPEQCRGKGTTAASDLYAVGVMLFEMAVGRRPFPGPSIPDFLVQHTSTLPPSARETSAELPLALDVIVHRAMEKDPGARFKNAAEFLKAVLELHRGLTPALDVTPGPQGSPTAERVALIPGVVLGGRYELVRILGQGGMGQVWLAKDQSMDLTEVAVKVLPPELWRDADSRVSLVKEAKLSLRLAHPCIVRLINLESGVSPFPVMEYVAGLSLGDELAGRRELDAGPMTPAEALPIVEDLAAALDHAHEQKVIHRDIKPSNVMLQCRPGGGFRAKLADFGIAAELISFKSRQTGVVPAGTLAYMSPEQVACQKLDARSDVYALGANLYQMLTIAPTFAGGDLAWAIQNAPVPEPEGVPQTIARVVLRALARKPDDRPATAGALAEELCRAVKGGSVRAESCESSADDGGGRIAKQFGSDGQGESCGLSATPGG